MIRFVGDNHENYIQLYIIVDTFNTTRMMLIEWMAKLYHLLRLLSN